MLSQAAQKKVQVSESIKAVKLSETRWGKHAPELGIVLIVMAVGLGFRLYHLTFRSIWLDEASNVLLAHETSFLETLTLHRPWNVHPPLFYIVMHVWIKFFGLGEAALRIFSVLNALATMLILYFLVRHWLGRSLALVTLVLMAVSPLQIFWSQSIRPYAWLTLLVTISMGAALFASDKPTQNWRWFLYGLSAFTLIYAHYLGFHVVFTQVLFLFIVLFKQWKALLRLATTLALVALAFLPYLGNFLEQSRFGATFYTNRGATQFLDAFQMFAIWYLPDTLVSLAGAIFTALYLLGVIWLWRKAHKLALFFVSWSFLPVITAWLSSLIRPNFDSFKMSFCVPAVLVIIAAGLWSLGGPVINVLVGIEKQSNIQIRFRLISWTLLLVILGLNLIASLNYTNNYRYQDWRGVVNHIVANRQPGDVIFLSNPSYTFGPIEYYYTYMLGAPGKMERRSVSEQVTDQMVQDVFKGANRVWMVSSYDSEYHEWIGKNIIPKVPGNFKPTFYKDFVSIEQNNLGLTLFVKQK